LEIYPYVLSVGPGEMSVVGLRQHRDKQFYISTISASGRRPIPSACASSKLIGTARCSPRLSAAAAR
jgi:hypothetical protein